MVVTDNFRSKKYDKKKILIYAFTKKIVFANESDPCSSHCGDIRKSTECNLEPVHSKKLAPPENAFERMERQRPEISPSHEFIESSSCFLVQHSPNSECLQCFPGKLAWELSPITFLVKLSTHLEVADNSECPFKRVSGCEEMELMPGIMCEFELGSVKVDFDINLASNEENQSSPITNSRKPKLVHVAKVVVFMWHIQKPEDTEVSELYECFLCLTRKRKVVLISVAKRYLWIAVSDEAKLLSNCNQCIGKLKEGAEFAYNQFLRQVPSLHVKDFFAVAGSKKRNRGTDSFQASGKKLKSH